MTFYIVCGALHLLSPHYKVNSEGNTCEFKPTGFRAKKFSSIIFHPKKLSGITVRVENGIGTKQAKRPTTHKLRSNLLRVSILKLQSSRHYYRKTELGTKTARSQLCIISSVSVSFTLIIYPIGCNLQVLNPYYTSSGII